MDNSTIKSALQQTIGDLEAKSLQVAEGDFAQKISSERVRAAQARIGSAEAKVDTKQASISQINEKLNPPPTKEVSSGGKSGGTKKVVDQDEVRRLNSQKQTETAALNQAKNEVEAARQEASDAAGQALVEAGFTADVTNELNTLQSRISSIASQLEKGESVDDQDIINLANDIDTFTEQFSQEDNKGDLLGNAIYDPLAAGLKDILELVNNPVEQQDDTPVGAPDDTINKELEDIGIVGQQQIDITDFIERLSNMSVRLERGEQIPRDETQKLYDDYKDIKVGLTPEQASSDFFKRLDKDVEDVIKATGHEGILPVTAGGGE